MGFGLYCAQLEKNGRLKPGKNGSFKPFILLSLIHHRIITLSPKKQVAILNKKRPSFETASFYFLTGFVLQRK